jgi:hypothetical protein
MLSTERKRCLLALVDKKIIIHMGDKDCRSIYRSESKKGKNISDTPSSNPIDLFLLALYARISIFEISCLHIKTIFTST